MKKNPLSVLIIIYSLIVGLNTMAFAQQVSVVSPDKAISMQLLAPKNPGGLWSVAVSYKNNSEVLPHIKLGLLREDADFAHNLNFKGAGKVQPIHDQYIALHGKRSVCTNDANEINLQFFTSEKKEIDITLRAYNNGIAFKYSFPEKSAGQYKMLDE